MNLECVKNVLLVTMIDKSDKFVNENTGFQSIETVGSFVLILIQRCWRTCSAGILFLLLLYWINGGLIILILLSTALVGAFYHYQDALLFFPNQPESSRVYVPSASRLGLPNENLYIKTEDGVLLNAVFLKQEPSRIRLAPTMLFFHGNAGNIGHRLVNAHSLYSYCGCNVLLVEYRGYGKSDGSPSETGFQLDAEAALSYLYNREDINKQRIVYYGRSLGGAVSIYLASREEFANIPMAVIVENTFTSIPEIAKHIFPVLSKLPTFCHRNRFPSIDCVPRISCPVLFLSGLADQLVPPAMMMQLFQTCGCSLKRMETFETGTHNDTWQCYGYTDAINRFLQEVFQANQNGLLINQSYSQAKLERPLVYPNQPGKTQEI